jgi:hypothetical protein
MRTLREAAMTDPDQAERLNLGCFCITLDRAALMESLNQQVGAEDFAQGLATSHPSLFSNVSTFVTSETLSEMARVIDAVEAAARLPGYREAALSWAPPIAGLDFGPIGAFMSYDFHIGADGPKLIEVNTNAGGAFLNAALAGAQRACCSAGRTPFDIAPAQDFGAKVAQMFVDEWRRQRGSGRPTLIAIVDDAPEQQYLFPEFKLAKAALEQHGFECVIADAKDLVFDGRAPRIEGRALDLVYNRLVDFALDEPRHAALRAAYAEGAVVVTPNPRAHALFADKRNLTLLCDDHRLRQWGLAESHITALRTSVLRTVVVTPDGAEVLWNDRRSLFFKPAGGYGGKAAYRGEKLTRKVWAEIIAGDYIAQAYAAPSTRGVQIDDARAHLKVDVRLYTYAGVVLLSAARLYQGQTTNMRTPGGGFAPVLEVGAQP